MTAAAAFAQSNHTIYVYRGGEKTEIAGVDSIAFATESQADNKRDIIYNLISNMVCVEGGTFTMGATEEQGSDAYEWEKPAHEVTVSNFSIGKYEVTQREWKAVMGSNPSRFNGDNLPVENVSWEECQEFISKLNALTGKNFRLPTEAEWEYAARGGSKSQGYKYAGSNNLDDVAWYAGKYGEETHEVGKKSPNELGLYDMSGNVWEWCNDWAYEYSIDAQTDPQGPTFGNRRVGRGGCWGSNDIYCRVAYRSDALPGTRLYNLGFRLVLEENEEVYGAVSSLLSDMVYVEGGTYMMGATAEQESDANSDEKPTHRVTVSSFYIGKHEVTQELWKLIMGNNPSYHKGDKFPVEQVSHSDCQKFIRWLGYATGMEFRLPTEAEWEFAARGGNKSKGYKYAGSDNMDEVAWYEENTDESHEVCTKAPNELGIYDMSGNVYEWVYDRYGAYSAVAQIEPCGPSYGSYRVYRGGSFCSPAKSCRVSFRNHYGDVRSINTGFRLAISKSAVESLRLKQR